MSPPNSNSKFRFLLGIHNPDIRKSYRGFFRLAGYEVDESPNTQDIVQQASTASHRIYLMDLNFGSAGEKGIQPAKEVYEKVKQRVESGEAKFLGISGEPENVYQAESEGIHSAHTAEFLLKDLLI